MSRVMKSVSDGRRQRIDRPAPAAARVKNDTVKRRGAERGQTDLKVFILARILAWPDTVVEEVGLAHDISQLRRVLRNGIDDSAFIETVPKRGYRSVAPVAVVSLADRARQEPPTRIILGVLPFENLAGDPLISSATPAS
jgi:hypothetical protein